MDPIYLVEIIKNYYDGNKNVVGQSKIIAEFNPVIYRLLAPELSKNWSEFKNMFFLTCYGKRYQFSTNFAAIKRCSFLNLNNSLNQKLLQLTVCKEC